MIKLSRHPLLLQLLQAKKESDRKHYDKKHEILLKLMKQHPDEFTLDSSLHRFRGITHKPTGFKFHVPASLTAPLQS